MATQKEQWEISIINLLTKTLSIFDFIECFTTTFLRAHSWLNWVDEDPLNIKLSLKKPLVSL